MARTAALTLLLAIATVLFPLGGLRAEVDAQDWHHEVEIPRPPRKGKPRGPAIGNLWIPPKTKQLIGLVVAEKTLLEKRLAAAEGRAVDDELRQRVRRQYPPPAHLEFRMHAAE